MLASKLCMCIALLFLFGILHVKFLLLHSGSLCAVGVDTRDQIVLQMPEKEEEGEEEITARRETPLVS